MQGFNLNQDDQNDQMPNQGMMPQGMPMPMMGHGMQGISLLSLLQHSQHGHFKETEEEVLQKLSNAFVKLELKKKKPSLKIGSIVKSIVPSSGLSLPEILVVVEKLNTVVYFSKNVKYDFIGFTIQNINHQMTMVVLKPECCDLFYEVEESDLEQSEKQQYQNVKSAYEMFAQKETFELGDIIGRKQFPGVNNVVPFQAIVSGFDAEDENCYYSEDSDNCNNSNNSNGKKEEELKTPLHSKPTKQVTMMNSKPGDDPINDKVIYFCSSENWKRKTVFCIVTNMNGIYSYEKLDPRFFTVIRKGVVANNSNSALTISDVPN